MNARPSSPAAPTRYVVLRHMGHGPEHVDLMIETGSDAEGLATWRAPSWPLVDGSPLTSLGVHRRAYLEYEGPVSGGRGEVRRIAAGWCRVDARENGVIVRFDDQDGAWLLGKLARRMSRYDPASHDGA